MSKTVHCFTAQPFDLCIAFIYKLLLYIMKRPLIYNLFIYQGGMVQSNFWCTLSKANYLVYKMLDFVDNF